MFDDYLDEGMAILTKCRDAKEELEDAQENFEYVVERGFDKYSPHYLAAKHRFYVAKAVMVDREEQLHSLGSGVRLAS